MARLDVLEHQVGHFRVGIERCDRSALPIGMQSFPRGACGDATLLLGTFLIERGFGKPIYILGTRPVGHREHSHAWLEIGRTIVDITADQFDEISDKVIVSHRSLWHRTFERECRGAADYRIYDPYTASVLGHAYHMIVEAMGN